ncbi:MAG: aldehyde dehydrogenase family protein, partial [Verrucomicrobia bacterium]|nr:aldehyde dehydrogenase family protein [Verrucomicrobiota bacterium]
MKEYQNFIGGEWVGAITAQTFENRNPADTREIVARYPMSGSVEAAQAIEAAAAAQVGWGRQTSVARGRVLSKAGQILEGR